MSTASSITSTSVTIRFTQNEPTSTQISPVQTLFIDQLEQATPSQGLQLQWKALISDLLSYDVDLDRAVLAGTHIAQYAGPAQVQDLWALMRLNDTFVMGVIAEPLARLQGAQALPALFRALRCIELEDANGTQLTALIGHVVRAQPGHSFQILMDLLGDPAQITRRDAVWAMSFLPAPLALPPLVSMLRDSRMEVRVSAANTLKHFRHPAVTAALIASLRDWESEVRCASAAALGWIGDPNTFNALAAACTDQDPLVRAFAREAIQQLPIQWSQTPQEAEPATV